MIVEIVLPGLESEAFSGGDVIGEVIEVEGLGGAELVVFDGFGVEVIVWFDRADILGKVMMIEEGKFLMFSQEGPGVDRVGVREKDEAVAVVFKGADDLPHGLIEAEDVFPCRNELWGIKVGLEDFEGLGDELLIGEGSGFVGVLKKGEGIGERGIGLSEDGLVKAVEVELEEDVADIEEEGHLRLGLWGVGGGQNEGGGLAGGCGACVLSEASFLLPPELGVVGEEISDGLLDRRC